MLRRSVVPRADIRKNRNDGIRPDSSLDDEEARPGTTTASHSNFHGRHYTVPSNRHRKLKQHSSKSRPAVILLMLTVGMILLYTYNTHHHDVLFRGSDWRAHARIVEYDGSTARILPLLRSEDDELQQQQQHSTSSHAKRIQIREPALTKEQSQRHTDWLPSEEEDDTYEVDEDGCVPRHEWMTKSFTNCYRMHEINMTPRLDSFVFINCGGDRCAFRLRDTDERQIVLKTQKFRRDFDPYTYDRARHDAVAMERLTSSSYIADIYGACATSQLVEYSEGGNLHDLIKLARLAGNDPMPRKDILRIGVQLSTAVADMHSFERDNVTSLTHQDLCCHQFILVDGVYKLNDFHLGVFARKNAETGEACHEYKIGYSHDLYKMRAPEEQAGMAGFVDHAKVDVFMLGNVLYYALNKGWLFPDYNTHDTGVRLKQGERSPFPKHILESDDPADKAMMQAIMSCWVHDVEKRPTARQVSDQLKRALSDITGDGTENVVRVVVPPLPKDYRYSDSDFYDNFY